MNTACPELPESEWLKDGGKARLARSSSMPMRNLSQENARSIKYRSNSSPLQHFNSELKWPAGATPGFDHDNDTGQEAHEGDPRYVEQGGENTPQRCTKTSFTKTSTQSADIGTENKIRNTGIEAPLDSEVQSSGSQPPEKKRKFFDPSATKTRLSNKHPAEDSSVDDASSSSDAIIVPSTGSSMTTLATIPDSIDNLTHISSRSVKPEVLKADQRRLHNLKARNLKLQGTLDELVSQRNELASQLRNLSVSTKKVEEPPSYQLQNEQMSQEQLNEMLSLAKATIKEHIALLHRYNDIRDAAQGLMGLIADQRGVRVKDVHEDFGIDAKD